MHSNDIKRARAVRRYSSLLKRGLPIPLELNRFIGKLRDNTLGELPEDILKERGIFNPRNDDSLRALANSENPIDMAQTSRQIDAIINQPTTQINYPQDKSYFLHRPFILNSGDLIPLLPMNINRKYLFVQAALANTANLYMLFYEIADSGNLIVKTDAVILNAGAVFEMDSIIPINAISFHNPSLTTVSGVAIIG